MSKNKKLEKAYRDLQMQEVPDLWNRIETNLKSQPGGCGDTGPGKQKINRYGAGMAAACAAIIIIGAWKGIGGWDQRLSSTGTVAVEEAATKAGTAMEDNGAAETHISAEGQDIKNAGMMAEGQSPNAQKILSYDSLSLLGTKAHLPLGEASFVPEDQRYFTEEVLKDTGLLAEAFVDSVSYEKDDQGRLSRAVYEIRVQRVLYSEDYVSEGQRLLVESPLVGSGGEVLYEMKEGGTYILPLKTGERACGLVFPYGPQIEVTKDQGYVFHNGFRSLVNEETSVVLMGKSAQEDYYYDRMVFRDDTVFLSNLTQLVESKRKDRRQA